MVELAIKHRIPWSRLAEMSSSRADPAETVNRRSTRMEEVIKSEEERDRLAKKRRVLVEKSENERFFSAKITKLDGKFILFSVYLIESL